MDLGQLLTDVRTIVIFLVTFTLIIAIHEFGHYASARLLGMRVLEFAFGFPPRAVAIRHAGIDYSINWIPFGGFVRILGQDDFSIRQQGEGEPGSFTSKPWWAQAIVLAAGVAMNFVLALVVLTAAFMIGTTGPTGDVKIVDVAAESPAAAAGLQKGDVIVAVDGRQPGSTRELVRYTQRNADREVRLDVVRNDRPIPPVSVYARPEPPEGQGPLGVKIEDVTGPVTVAPGAAVVMAWKLSGEVVEQIVALPGQMLGGRSAGPAPEVTGPIGIIQVTGQVAEFGLSSVLKLIGVLSLNLGVLNIIPFPGLDGGRLSFVLAQAAIRRRISPQLEAAIHAVGFVILLGLLVVVSIADIRRVLG
ncbi:MAG TPA: M50 family metallopeptidase [Candidatus Limnocylindria bacterium]|nr:M50 family metallopeptidase [Candidatus Limnocylindria bacterium]